MADDWKTLDRALTSITDALKDAGISFADIAKMQQGQMPKGADPQKLAALAPKLQEMSSAKVETASKNIEKHAKEHLRGDARLELTRRRARPPLSGGRSPARARPPRPAA